MERNAIIFRLQIIGLLDSLSYGLLYVFLSPYLIHLGGNQVTIGIFTVSTLIFQLMSIHIVRDMVNLQGQKAALLNILNIAAFTNALLILTSSNCFIIFARCLFSSTNQSSNLIKDFIIKNLSNNNKKYHLNLYCILHSIGYILGPTVAGALFDKHFIFVCVLASTLCVINIFLLITTPGLVNTPAEPSDVPAVKRVRQSVENRIAILTDDGCKSHWDILAIQYLFTTFTIIFSTKYAPVLSHRYHINHTELGLVTSYLNIVIFIAMYLSPRIKEKITDYPPVLTVNAMFSIVLTSTILSLFAPNLLSYCVLCIPAIYARIMIQEVWENFLGERKVPHLMQASDTVNIVSGLTIPLVFGALADVYGYITTYVFTIIPITIILIIINVMSFLNGSWSTKDTVFIPQSSGGSRGGGKCNDNTCSFKAKSRQPDDQEECTSESCPLPKRRRVVRDECDDEKPTKNKEKESQATSNVCKCSVGTDTNQ